MARFTIISCFHRNNLSINFHFSLYCGNIYGASVYSFHFSLCLPSRRIEYNPSDDTCISSRFSVLDLSSMVLYITSEMSGHTWAQDLLKILCCGRYAEFQQFYEILDSLSNEGWYSSVHLFQKIIFSEKLCFWVITRSHNFSVSL